jgi:hypothetical protein
MDWGNLLEWTGNQGLALLVAAIAVGVSYRAIKVTRAYQDPVFVMECEPRNWLDVTGDAEGVIMYLVNKGNSFARDVRWSADYDPLNVATTDQTWAFIQGNGGKVHVEVPFRATWMGSPVLGQLINRNDEASLCTVTFRSQAGHKVTQKVHWPNPYDFRPQEDASQENAARE